MRLVPLRAKPEMLLVLPPARPVMLLVRLVTLLPRLVARRLEPSGERRMQLAALRARWPVRPTVRRPVMPTPTRSPESVERPPLPGR
jgi:hypothetical protein